MLSDLVLCQDSTLTESDHLLRHIFTDRCVHRHEYDIIQTKERQVGTEEIVLGFVNRL